jgi:chromosome segregation ATPase
MRKLILGTLALVALVTVSCNQKKIERLEFQRDSIQQEKDLVVKERDEFLEIISEIQSNFSTIREVELGIIDQSQGYEKLNNEGKARIREDLEFITNKIQENKDRINSLEADLKKSQGQAAHYKNLVANLQKDLVLREKEITDLKAQLAEKDAYIEQLNTRVASLTHSKDSLSTLSSKQLAAIKAQEEEIYGGWYTMGKKAELKAKGMKEGDLKTTKFNKGNFKKIDIREEKEIDLGSKKAKLYTSHPAGSYVLEKKSANDKNLVLKIKDPKSFWSNSKYLIIQIN